MNANAKRKMRIIHAHNPINIFLVASVLIIATQLDVNRAQLVIEPFEDWMSQLLAVKTTKTPMTLKNDTNLIANLMDIFKLSRRDVKWLEMSFSLSSMELIYPKSLTMVRKLKRCVVGVNFRHTPMRSAAIKFEFDDQVRARYDEHSRTIVCTNPSRPANQGIPTER